MPKSACGRKLVSLLTEALHSLVISFLTKDLNKSCGLPPAILTSSGQDSVPHCPRELCWSGCRESNSSLAFFEAAETSQISGSAMCRGAENRTRISRSQSAYTTTVLHPDTYHFPKAHILPLYYAPANITLTLRAYTTTALHPELLKSTIVSGFALWL